jgi:hypothetical protein
MRRNALFVTAVALVVLAAPPSRAEVKVVWDRNTGNAATAEFKFKSVPSPSSTDAATAAKFSIVAGRRDRNGGDLDVLNDGIVPTEEDQPDANFFFAAGSEGGRILVDLGQASEVKQPGWAGGRSSRVVVWE